MSALVIVLVCVGGTIGYCAAAAYVYLRLLWQMKQTADSFSDPEIPAFFAAVVLPLGLGMLAVYSLHGVDTQGLPPRSVRRERRIKDQQEVIARLERELDLR